MKLFKTESTEMQYVGLSTEISYERPSSWRIAYFARCAASVLSRLLLQTVIVEFQLFSKVSVHWPQDLYSLWSFVMPFYSIVVECRCESSFEQNEDFEWCWDEALFFFFSFLSSVVALNHSRECPVNRNGRVISFLTGSYWILSCLNFTSLATVLSACCFTKRACSTVRVENLIR